MLNKFFEQPNNIYISIGEEGIVVVYFVGKQLSKKLFIRSTNEQDTIELRKILLSDPDAYIHIYIDVLDQTYVQRTLPAISTFSINKLAYKRLEKETPKTHLKSCIQIGRTEVGRNDWMYVFVSTAFEPPVSNWIHFFERYQNIIYGIQFLPVELSSVVRNLQKVQSSTNHASKVSILKKISLKPKGDSQYNISTWEVLLTLNKSGGFRQAVFQDGKVIFTRLLNSIIDPNPDVIAGSIEQEITNSLEYLRRLSLKEKDEVYINMIVSSDIKKNIRKNKFNAKEVHIYTPYEASKLLNLPEDTTKENDRFSDPLILASMHLYPRRIITVHTEETGKVFLYTKIFRYTINALKITIPFIILSILVAIFNIFGVINDIRVSEFQKSKLSSNLTEKVTTKAKEDQRFGIDADVEKIQEVVEFYNQFKQYDSNPLSVLQRFSAIKPDIARVKQVEIRYDIPQLKYIPKDDGVGYEKSSVTKYAIIGKFSVVFKNYGNSYEELIANYKDYIEQLSKEFKGFKITVSSLPESFTFEDFKKPLSLGIELEFPAEEVGNR